MSYNILAAFPTFNVLDVNYSLTLLHAVHYIQELLQSYQRKRGS